MSDQAPNPTAPAAGRPQWRSVWRASYRPGDWLVLTGPTSLVVLQPAAPRWSDLINAVWEDLLASSSIEQVAERMAAFRLDAMPDFGALFWEQGGMRSLVRGRVRVVDPDDGRVLSTGEGIRTWSETGLGAVRRVHLQFGEPAAAEEPALELPLVIGAVTASAVVLDAGADAQVTSPQGTFSGDAEAEPGPAEPGPSEPGSSESGPSEPGPGEPHRVEPEGDAASAELPVEAAAAGPGDAEPVAEPVGPPVAAAGVAAGGVDAPAAPGEDQDQRDDQYEMENESTLMDQPPVPPAPAEPAAGSDDDDDAKTIFASSLPGLSGERPAVYGYLRPSSGGRIEVDRPVVVGRAPVASRVAGPQLPRVLTVPSPSNDISRTHIQVAPEDGRLVVTDLESTNGTVLIAPDGSRRTLRPGEGVELEAGSVIDLGDGITITVDPAPSDPRNG